MGYLDRILGRKPRDKNGDDASDGPSAAAPEPAAPAAPEIVHEATSGAGYGPPSISSSQLPTSGIPGMMPLSPETTGGGTRLYDPYEGIAQSVGMKKQLFKMPEQPEFLFEEEASVRRRGWGENVQFYTGLGYITGAGTGVAAGGHRFLTMRPQFQGPETLKLKANRALNSVGMFARPLANGAGIIGLYFATADSLIYNKLDQNGLPDYLSSVLAGGVTGALFRSPRGPRQAAVAGAVGVVAGAGIVAARTVFPSL
uniref:Mitochondrial import inner membrane translocase subunit TIM23 n=1 Tax=Chlamydomonas euryale TaxID=1486919 RepID=A0A7R9YQH7_9CHLO|mmetsp:Transcript_11678/g.34540  ORF Transcript_11678/g.34540 Transcript_11678/m.34540 type:complete len:256 (+) Transcript_11678:140-907(+)